MTIAIIQTDSAEQSTFGSPVSTAPLSWPSTPTAGNTLYLFAMCSPTGASNKHIVEPAGWTILHHAAVNDMDVLLARRTSNGAETGVTLTFFDTAAASVSKTIVSLTEVSGVHEAVVVTDVPSGTHTIPDITPTGSVEALMLGFVLFGNAYGFGTEPSGYTKEDEIVADDGASERFTLWSQYDASTSGTYGATFTTTGGLDRLRVAQVWLSAAPPVSITITADPTSGPAILGVHFDTIAEGGTPSAYDWDFGDGGTSTDDNPIHAYTEPGVYNVTLTATIDGDDYIDTITITVEFADYTPPSPGRAILEIKASDPGSARWDVAEWDEAVWSSASWQDVTPYGVEVFITWGSSRPEFGILSTPDACTWSITFYDPDRVLDPANESSPYFGDLEPLLPVRLRLGGGQIVKQGLLESASHRYENDTGYWRVMDIQALLANAVVPPDTTLSDTLFARARDVISAAGLAITVAPDPPGGDPASTAWVTGNEATAWEWISDAAQQVMWVPYVREDNTLGFRDYRNPMNRGRIIGSPNLVGLQSLIMHNGLFSVVTAGVETRELTPKPRYGAREYIRDGVIDGTTPDDNTWAQAVLDDRAVAGLRWVPGRVVPFTAQEVKYFAELEAIEQVAISYPEASPPISVDGIIVGGEIRVRGKKDDDAIWEFVYHVAQVPTQPLVDDLDAESYLVRDDDPTEYLYPDA